jgi:hypothetical protein
VLGYTEGGHCVLGKNKIDPQNSYGQNIGSVKQDAKGKHT